MRLFLDLLDFPDQKNNQGSKQERQMMKQVEETTVWTDEAIN